MRLRRRRALNPRFARGMGVSSAVRKQALRPLLHRPVDHVVLAQAAEALARLLLHAVVSTGLRAANAPLSGDPEPLGGGFLRLHLRHGADLGSRGTARRPPGRRGCAKWSTRADLSRPGPPTSAVDSGADSQLGRDGAFERV